MDPDNHIYYSNRAAAHMAADSISKSLRDAERCVALAPGWAKGYGRLGAAQHGLRRFDAAIATYKTGKDSAPAGLYVVTTRYMSKGIEIDPTSDALWRALRMAEEAQQVRCMPQ